MAEKISIDGFIDIHIHTAPAPFTRIGDTAQVAKWCAEAGMGGAVIKSHFESTVSKVHHGQEAVPDYPGFKLFAGVALNRGVGGINPGAVEIALHQGAKMVWLPTFDSCAHINFYGGAGKYGGFKSMSLGFRGGYSARGNYTVLDEGKRLTAEAKEVIDIIIEYDAVLSTAHVSKEEIYAVAEYAQQKGLKRMCVTHPEAPVPDIGVDAMVELSRQGIYMEFCAVNCFPMTHTYPLDRMKEAMEAVGPDYAIISSDSGQPWMPKPPEALRTYAQGLHEKGLSPAVIRRMGKDNPERLLGVA
ncbi:DUF6282 family protein [uncultured Alsobacter sp.]|uniref:DUF6282 family protein n=1 Tax=uncultured Alsobacter sp. TaxID=1748258 RepID=UPI0025F8E56B|nr:DUF6282 family protein [uncultured Alsobacter sp.]